jgi:small subunit ribosomal protein S15
MARMYSGKHGKSGSTKPVRKIQPSWVKYKPFEVEKLVVKLAKEGKSSAQIGITLRDMYGIPSVRAVTKKKIQEIMNENKVAPELPEDITNLIKRVIATELHHNTNKKDQSSKRGLQLTESKIRRLMKYYKRIGKIPQEWNYAREQAKFLVK